jgi:uracil-DNA glycosylase
VTRDDASRETRLVRLAELYDEIWDWASTKYDRHLVKRKVEAVDPTSRLFIVGEAHAEDQVRLTGINWFDAWGTLGRSGENLDAILRCLRYTVYPPQLVRLPRGQVQPKDSALTTVYTTDVFPCYPPGGGTPAPVMVTDALKQRFLARELEILQPRKPLIYSKTEAARERFRAASSGQCLS